MVIERFKPGQAAAVYRRFRANGRMLPEGLHYLDSWVDSQSDRCFQLMETHHAELFAQWIAHWQDLVEFEIVEVVPSREAANRYETDG
jgi:hypothetical protein